MFKSKNIKTIIIPAILSSCAFGYISEIYDKKTNGDLTNLFLTVGFFLLFAFKTKEKDKLTKICICVPSALFALFTGLFFFYKVEALGHIHTYWYNAFALFCVLFGSFLAFCKLIGIIYDKTEILTCGSTENAVTDKKVLKKLFCKYFLIIFLCHLFYFLLSLPGNLMHDNEYQMFVEIGMAKLTTHHPIIHTLIFGKLYILGIMLFGDERGGVALYTFVQMLFYSFSCAYMVKTMVKTGFDKKAVRLVLLFNALYPPIGYFSVTDTKDVWESGCIIILMSLIWQIIHKPLLPKEEDTEKKLPFYKRQLTLPSWTIYFFVFLFTLLTALFRSGGIYCCAAMFLFALIFNFKGNKRTVALIFAAIISALIIRGPVYMNLLGATTEAHGQRDISEMLSVPYMQIARALNTGVNLSESEKAELDKIFVNTDNVAKIYGEFNGVSDYMKSIVRQPDGTRTKYLLEHKKDYFLLWLKLGLRKPFEYIRAYVHLTCGYWLPSVRECVYFDDGYKMHFIDSLPDWTVFGQKGEAIIFRILNLYQKIPVLGLLFSMALQMWIVVVAFFKCIAVKKTRYLILFIPMLATWGILLVGAPIWDDMRYIQPVSSVFIWLCMIPFFGGELGKH